ncbi:hypothetical protein Slin15195_G073420 [Septoria linicola]|uniref:Uncharacterized protein n=1 Tax=Septoria linicola TaxID=215465 RepID=A0A9Q9AVM1_9PEZI|nr:hypothetical protein Slin15195_G073420 [Septoria linicola]
MRSSQRNWSSFTAVAVLLLAFLWFTPSVSAHATEQPTIPHIHGTSFSAPIGRRGNDGNDASKTWWPFMGVEMQLSDDKIEQLPYPESEKQKLRAASKGLRLLCKMKSPVSNPPTRSDFRPSSRRPAAAIMSQFGWESWANRAVANLDSYGLNIAFDDLGISRTPKDWIKSMTTHARDTEDALAEYPATFASYDSMYNFKDGVLVAVANWSPEAMIKNPEFSHIDSDQVTPLRRWSDVVWLHREKVMSDLRVGNTASRLEHIFQHNVVNSQAEAIFQMITGKRNAAEVGTWPGVSYPIEEPQALAALSSSNGFGPAWLLIQHKDAGSRMIDRINIFNCAKSLPGTSGDWCLYLHVTDTKKGLFLECKKKTPLADISIPQSIYQQHSELEFYSWHVDIPSDRFDLSFAENIDYYPDLGISPGPPH